MAEKNKIKELRAREDNDRAKLEAYNEVKIVLDKIEKDLYRSETRATSAAGSQWVEKISTGRYMMKENAEGEKRVARGEAKALHAQFNKTRVNMKDGTLHLIPSNLLRLLEIIRKSQYFYRDGAILTSLNSDIKIIEHILKRAGYIRS